MSKPVENTWRIHGCTIRQVGAETPADPLSPEHDGWSTTVERDGTTYGPFAFTGDAVRKSRELEFPVLPTPTEPAVEAPAAEPAPPAEPPAA